MWKKKGRTKIWNIALCLVAAIGILAGMSGMEAKAAEKTYTEITFHDVKLQGRAFSITATAEAAPYYQVLRYTIPAGQAGYYTFYSDNTGNQSVDMEGFLCDQSQYEKVCHNIEDEGQASSYRLEEEDYIVNMDDDTFSPGYNFYITHQLEAGKTYYFIGARHNSFHKGNYKLGLTRDFQVNLDNQGAEKDPGTQVIYTKGNLWVSTRGDYAYAASGISLPDKEGYIFKGYYTEPGGKGEQYINESGRISESVNEKITSDLTLYAKWESKEKVKKITLNPASLGLTVGESRTIRASLEPNDVMETGVSWTSSDTKVATVEAGVVKAVKEGKAAITCTANDGGGASASCLVTVKAKESAPTPDVSKKTTSRFLMLRARAAKTKIRVGWNKVKGASGYIVYGAKCGKKMKVLKTIRSGSKTTWLQTKLKAGTAYKYRVRAYQTVNGKKVYTKSNIVHIATTGGKYTNAKRVTISRSSYTLKKGRTRKISAKVIPISTKKRMVNHAAKLRYRTSNSKVATVSKKGVVKAVKAGKCYLYVYANNGMYKRVTIMVK